MKKSMKLLVLTMVMVMAMALLAGCGKASTFEEYCKSDDELMAQLEDIAVDNDQMTMTVELSGNDVIYSAKYKTAIDESVVEDVKAYFEEAMAGYASTFETIAKTCEEYSEIDGITVKVEYLNADGSELYTAEYTSGE